MGIPRRRCLGGFGGKGLQGYFPGAFLTRFLFIYAQLKAGPAPRSSPYSRQINQGYQQAHQMVAGEGVSYENGYYRTF